MKRISPLPLQLHPIFAPNIRCRGDLNLLAARTSPFPVPLRASGDFAIPLTPPRSARPSHELPSTTADNTLAGAQSSHANLCQGVDLIHVLQIVFPDRGEGSSRHRVGNGDVEQKERDDEDCSRHSGFLEYGKICL